MLLVRWLVRWLGLLLLLLLLLLLWLLIANFAAACDGIKAAVDVRQRQEDQGGDPQQGPRCRLMTTQTQRACAAAAAATDAAAAPAAAAAADAVVVVVAEVAAAVLADCVAIAPRFSLQLLAQPAGLSPHWSLPKMGQVHSVRISEGNRYNKQNYQIDLLDFDI